MCGGEDMAGSGRRFHDQFASSNAIKVNKVSGICAPKNMKVLEAEKEKLKHSNNRRALYSRLR